MWNGRKYAAMTIVGAGLAVAAATPASAWWWPFGGAGYSFGPYGYSGAYSYSYADYAPYGYVSYDSDYGPAYGYADYGYRRLWGAVSGCGWAANYAVACRRPAGLAAVSNRLHRPYAAVASSPRPHLNVAVKPAQNKVVCRVPSVKLAHNG